MAKQETALDFRAPNTTNLERVFYAYERFIKNLETPGGRIFVLLILVVGGYGASALGVPYAQNLASAASIALILVLVRDARSPGFLAGLLSIIRKPPSSDWIRSLFVFGHRTNTS